jgi:phospholipid/cholesterol/gamma-HCH transport system ATP-binding protein
MIALSVSSIHQVFAGNHSPLNYVLNGVSFNLEKGVLAGLVGPSSGGKSTLLKILTGIRPPTSGTVNTFGVKPTLLFQEGALFDSLNVFDNVAFPLVEGKVPTVLLSKKLQYEVHERVDAILNRVGLLWAAHKMPAELSGGMRRRVSLARTLVTNPQLALLDDPTSGLDPIASSVIMDLIVELHSEYNTSIIIVSHDLRRLLPRVKKVYALFNGVISYEGDIEGLKKSDCQEIIKFISCRYDIH